MRGRLKVGFDAFKEGTRGHSRSFSVPYVLVGATAVLGVGAYAVNDVIDKNRMNREFPHSGDIQRFHSGLKQKFIQVSPYGDAYAQAFNGLLNAIDVGDFTSTKAFLTDLIKADALTPDLRDDLIVFASNHSKIEVLQLFKHEFGVKRVYRNNHARKLLSLSEEDRIDATEILEACYQGPGQIKPYHMAKYVLTINKALPRQIMAGMVYQPLNVVDDLAEDIANGYRQTVMVGRILENIDAKILHSKVICTDEHPGYLEEIEHYFRSLLGAVDATQAPVVGTVVLAGGHYTIMQIKVEKSAAGESIATLLHIDPLGVKGLSMLNTGFFDIPSIPHRIFDHVHLLMSEEVNQTTAPGCSHFVCGFYKDLLSLDTIMTRNSQYEFSGETDAVFDYARHHTTRMIPYGYGFDPQSGCYEGVAEMGHFVLPAFMIVSKQSIDGEIEIEGHIDKFVQLPDGRYQVDYDTDLQSAPIVTLGTMGVSKSRKASPPERQAEFKKPADVESERSVDEVIASAIVDSDHNGHTKPQNRRNEHLGYDIGFFLSRNLDVALKEDVRQVSPNIKKHY